MSKPEDVERLGVQSAILFAEVVRSQRKLLALRCREQHPGEEGQCIHILGHAGMHQYPGLSDNQRLWPYPDTQL